MIASLHGKVIEVSEDNLILEVAGVGFRVWVMGSTCAKLKTGDVCLLYTHLVVRQDLLALYGFEQDSERKVFVLLMGADGVGPRLAMAILSILTIETITRAVLSEQSEIFSRVPGVGKKTAQKIVISLQGKVGKIEGDSGYPVLDIDNQVLEAMTALGYSIVEAQTALQSIPKNGPSDLESRILIALQFFSR